MNFIIANLLLENSFIKSEIFYMKDNDILTPMQWNKLNVSFFTFIDI